MSRDAYVLNNGRIVYRPGHQLQDARDLAATWAKRHPGRTFTVVRIDERYQFPRPARKSGRSTK